MSHESHAKRFWSQRSPETGFYEHVLATTDVAEEHDEEDDLWQLLFEELPGMTPGQQQNTLCALADREVAIPKHLQDVVVSLLGSTQHKVAANAASCLLSCAGAVGRLRVRSVLVTHQVPHAIIIKQLLYLREQRATGEVE